MFWQRQWPATHQNLRQKRKLLLRSEACQQRSPWEISVFLWNTRELTSGVSTTRPGRQLLMQHTRLHTTLRCSGKRTGCGSRHGRARRREKSWTRLSGRGRLVARFTLSRSLPQRKERIVTARQKKSPRRSNTGRRKRKRHQRRRVRMDLRRKRSRGTQCRLVRSSICTRARSTPMARSGTVRCRCTARWATARTWSGPASTWTAGRGSCSARCRGPSRGPGSTRRRTP
mmetsp:Transcript_570/g.1347  ORF Transcript_570/g.1347 Transcript_570/m.1347 type:complete len:229 (+) Transcript_570:336-1022(+)